MMNGMMKREDSSAMGSLDSIEADDEYALPAFGYPKNNHGWVKCNSKTFPRQDYYFNVESACSTWIRPVSRFVPTPLVRPLNRMHDEDFLDATPIGVSDIDDDEEDDYNNNREIMIEESEDNEDVKSARISKKEAKKRKIYNDVLFKLYHCYGDQWNVEETEDVKPFAGASLPCDYADFDDDGTGDYEIFLPEATYSSGSDGETTESLNAISHNNSILSESFGSLCESHSWGRKSPEFYGSLRRDDGVDEKSSGTFKTPNMIILNKWKSPKKIATPEKYFLKGNASFEIPENHENVAIPKFDYQLQNGWHSRDDDDSDDSDTVERDYVSSDSDTVERDYESTDSTLSGETCREVKWGLDDESDGDEANDENCEKKNLFALPTLKTIEFSDLLTEPWGGRSTKKNRKRKASKNIERIDKRTSKKVIKTVCVLNGITTVNYDYLTPQLPDGVVMTNLSDSGSSACYDAWKALRDNERTTQNPSNNETNASPKRFQLSHNILDITDPYLSESSTSSESNVGGKKSKVKKQQLESKNISEDSESDSSDSSSSSSGSSTRSRNDDEERRKLLKVAKEDVNKASDSSSSSNSDKSWICDGSEDDEDC